jgi:gluconate 5-dehydrogenase
VRVQELFDLSGRTALVTGGGRGIGRHIAVGLAEAGADVIVASRKLANCEETAALLSALGRRAWALQVDLADAASIDGLADAVLGTVDHLDVLINNAGVIWGAPTLEYPMAGWDRTFAVNVRGLWQLSQRMARHMAERGGGSIVHVSVDLGVPRLARRRRSPRSPTTPAKGAVNTLTKDMAVKLARYKIRVNSIAPGRVRHRHDGLRARRARQARALPRADPARAPGWRGRREGRRGVPRQRRGRLRDRPQPDRGRRLARARVVASQPPARLTV